MEVLQGKASLRVDAAQFQHSLRPYHRIRVDIGTGDGRYVRHIAQQHPGDLVIGIDASREKLADCARRAPRNARFLIANVQALPPELRGIAAEISINFPWASLLAGLLLPESEVIANLRAIAGPGAALHLRLNAGALSELGWALEAGALEVRAALLDGGFRMPRPRPISASDLRAFPSTWAKRLAFGRDPRAVYMVGQAD